MTSDPKARLDAMVREKAKALAGHEAYMLNYNEALVVIALDLLSKLDAAEAQVKALEDADAHALCAKLRASQAREWELRQKLFRSDCNAMGEGWGHTLCAEQRDAAEAQVKALTAELEEADKGLLFWRGIPAYTLDMTYDEAMSSKAVEAALARQKARAALKLGGEK